MSNVRSRNVREARGFESLGEIYIFSCQSVSQPSNANDMSQIHESFREPYCVHGDEVEHLNVVCHIYFFFDPGIKKETFKHLRISNLLNLNQDPKYPIYVREKNTTLKLG